MSHTPTASEPQRTPLYDRHLAHGAKVIDFGGWALPLQYTGILDEHRTVRQAVGLFDVSHMGEIEFRGEDAARAVQRLTTNDVSRLVDGAAQYTTTCREDGGIVDDCIVYRHAADHFLIVVNAANVAKDFAHFTSHGAHLAEVTDRSAAWALLAVQGPRALALVGELTSGVLPPRPFTLVAATVASPAGRLEVTVARTGYTGEDGVEIFVPPAAAPALWDRLVEAGGPHGLKPIGLGARDTLRLEARLCLYGNDIDEDHNPIEAGLGWVVKGGGFVGEAPIAAARAAGATRRLIGFRVRGRGIARHGYPILDGDHRVGVVTSGTTGPTVGVAVGMGYVPAPLARPGQLLTVDCRGKPAEVEVVAGPFYKRPQ